MWLWGEMSADTDLSNRSLKGAGGSLSLCELTTHTSLGGRLEELRGASVVLATSDQLAAAVALIELDGVARRVVLCPADTSTAHFPQIVREARCDAWVGSIGPEIMEWGVRTVVQPGPLVPCAERRFSHETEWVLLTSGTTGAPKLVVHSASSLTHAFAGKEKPAAGTVWSTFYDIRRYGGLQILLRGLLGASLVFSSPTESVEDFLARATAGKVTHLSGTPSHWRKAMISGATANFRPQYVRLSGEIADQAILDALHRTFPGVTVAHAFASTEAGVGFEVRDGLAGFPAGFVGAPGLPALIQVMDGRLRLKSGGTAKRYLGENAPALRSSDDFVDTGDRVELRDQRYYFMGRSGGVINVGGQKVHPEEIESVINSLPWVHISRVAARKNPITGAIVVAEVVRSSDGPGKCAPDDDELRASIAAVCRETLAPYKVPASIRFVPSLEVAPSGKLVRANA